MQSHRVTDYAEMAKTYSHRFTNSGMDQKQHSQKRPWYRRDDANLSCPDCNGSEDHLNKSCPQSRLIENTDKNRTTVGPHTDDLEKRQCHRCDDCHTSFTDSKSLEDHKKKNCLRKAITPPSQTPSYELCMDALKSAMDSKKSAFDSFMNARCELKDAVMRYAVIKQRKESAHDTLMQAVFRERALCTISSIEEQLIISDIVTRCSDQFKSALNEEHVIAMEVAQFLHKLKNTNQAATFAASKEQFAFMEVIKAFKEQPLSETLSPRSLNKELIKIRSIVEQSHNVLHEFQEGVAELESSVSVMLGGVSKKEQHRTVERSDLTVNREHISGGNPIHNLQEKLVVENEEVCPMDVISENIDDPKPSTSGSY